MKKIIIWGVGKGAQRVLRILKKENCDIICFVDNDITKRKNGFMGRAVRALEDIPQEFDYIIISNMKQNAIEDIKEQLSNAGAATQKIIAFWDKNSIQDFDLYDEFVNISEWKVFFLEREVEHWKKLVCDLDEKYSKLIQEQNKFLRESIETEDVPEYSEQSQKYKKPRIYIWGTGKGAKEVLGYLFKDNCRILGFLDNNEEKQGQLFADRPILGIEQIEDFDYIIIATKILESTRSILGQLLENNIPEDKIIPFFDNEKVIIKNEFDFFVNTDAWRSVLLTREVNSYERLYKMKIDNMIYEVADVVKNGKILLPNIAPIEHTLDLIINKHCSIVRYGDGELGLIDKQRFHKFQRDDDRLAKRLYEVLQSKEEKCLIAIADNYGSLDKMTDRGAESIRRYMTSGAREIQMRLLDMDRVYHNAYLTRPYIYFRDKENAGKRFADIKKIWDKRDVVIIEGNMTRLGIGNDLLDNAKSIRRILGPGTNAFDRYDQIMEEALKIQKDILFLVALGPTATVMAYDLFKAGYQAIDIGHIDVEYEWYRMGVENPVKIENKYVCEAVNGDEVGEEKDSKYLSQVIARIY